MDYLLSSSRESNLATSSTKHDTAWTCLKYSWVLTGSRLLSVDCLSALVLVAVPCQLISSHLQQKCQQRSIIAMHHDRLSNAEISAELTWLAYGSAGRVVQ